MSKFIDIQDKKYSRLLVIKRVGSYPNRASKWLCLCDCGKIITTRSDGLKNGIVKSCGCWKKEIVLKTMKGNKHAEKHNESYGIGRLTIPEYIVWVGMKQRCYNPNSDKYKYYGARGIKVCSRWRENYENFLEDMGRKPSSKYTIDRIDNGGDYTPDNCKWSTPKEQANNRRLPCQIACDNRL